jgi:hypothetical protein
MIAITFDIDWAPDEIVDEIISLLNEYNAPATFFCTNFTKDNSGKSSSLIGRVQEQHEIALHPNFQHVENYATEWNDLLTLYPTVTGWRSHNGMSGWPIMKGALDRGLRYEVFSSVFSGYVAPCQVNRALKGYHVFTTAFWDSHMLHEPEFSWTLDELPQRSLFEDDDKIFVLGFHPNILYYDMRTVHEYNKRKSSYHVVDVKSSFHQRKEHLGAMRLMLELLNTVPKKHFTTLSDFGAKVALW